MARNTDSPVSKTFVQVNLTGGLNAKVDSHQLQNGQLKTADNVIFGAVEGQVTKRYGCTSINPQGAPLQGGPFKALGIRDNIEPLILGASTLNRYNAAQNLSTSIPTPTQGRVDAQQVVGSTGQTTLPWPPSDPSCASDGSQYLCLVWQEPNATGAFIFYGVQDLASGTWIIPPTQIPANSNIPSGETYVGQMSPSVKFYNGNFYIFYLSTTVSGSTYYQRLVYGILPVTNLAGGFNVQYSGNAFSLPSTSIQATLSPNPYSYDVHIANGTFVSAIGPQPSDNQTFCLSFGAVGAGGVLTLSNAALYKSSLVSAFQRCAVRADGPAATPYLFACATDLITYTNKFVASPSSLQGVVGANSAQRQVVDCLWLPDGTIIWAGCFITGSSASVRAIRVNPATNTVLTFLGYQSPVTTAYLQLLSRLFTIKENSKVYAWVGGAAPSSDSIYNNAYLAEFDFVNNTTTTACRTLYQKNAHITNADMTFPCEVMKVANSSKYVTFISSALEKLSATDYHAYGALNRVQFDFAPSRAPQLVSLPQGGVLGAGAYPFYYDGISVMEAGFSTSPTGDAITNTFLYDAQYVPTVSASTSSVGLSGGRSAVTPSGFIEYYYVVCFVRRDSYGNVYRSAPSPVITVQCPNTYNIVTFPSYSYQGGGNVQVEYYRSTQNTPGSHYFLGQTANGGRLIDQTPDGSTAPSQNNSITGRRLVYTDANEVPNDPPPPVHHAAVSETRVFLIPSDARSTIWFSKTFSPGRTVEFSANNVLSEGGSNTALFTAINVMDQYVIVFKADQILYFYGNGPDNAGNGSFSSFQKISTDVGCIDPGSIVTIPDGILFRSRRGIELLNRSLQVSYVGAPVEPLVAQITAIGSAVVVPRFTQVRFVPITAGQPVLVYDYGHNRWSTFSNMASLKAESINGVYWWISTDGAKVYQEVPNLYTDDGRTYTMTIETPEIPVGAGGLQGWGRAYRMALLGDYFGSHNLQVSFAYDHQTNYPDSVVFNTTTGLISGDAVYQFRCSRLPRQVMQTLRIKIQDNTNVGQSCAISSIALEVGSKSGLAKLPAQKTI